MAAEKKKRNVKKIVVRVLIGVAAFLLVEWCFIGWKFNFGPFKALGEIRLKGMPGNSDAYDFSKKLSRWRTAPCRAKRFCSSAPRSQTVPPRCTSPSRNIFCRTDGLHRHQGGRGRHHAVRHRQSSYIQRMLNNVDPDQQIDLVVCQLSTNDASKGMPLGDFGDDTATITAGAIEYIIRYAKGRGTARWCSTRTPAMTATPTLPWSAACMKLPKKRTLVCWICGATMPSTASARSSAPPVHEGQHPSLQVWLPRLVGPGAGKSSCLPIWNSKRGVCMAIKAVQQFMLGIVLGNENQARQTLTAMKAAGYDGIELCGFMIHPIGFYGAAADQGSGYAGRQGRQS